MSASESSFPRHLAIIMDGNGRWATQHALPRKEGHRQGVETVRRVVREVGELEIPYLTLYSFSTENWTRPEAEVKFLFGLLERYIEADLAELHRDGVRVRIIGRRRGLENRLVGLIDRAEKLTVDNSNMYLQIAFNYGGRQELADAAARLARRALAGTLDASAITPEVLEQELLTAGLPDPDLVIRTGGEHRISNFLLWQLAYSEFFFTNCLWPDFTRDDLLSALEDYRQRERRYGTVETRSGGF
ncbi:MAG: isoprenyl transferase [Parvibaculales bacterium]